MKGKIILAIHLIITLSLLFIPFNMVYGQIDRESITVEDQELGEDNMITIDQIDSPGDGWVLIHMEEDGEPGQVIGSEAIEEGENMNVMVEIDEDMADMISDGDTLYAALLVDPEPVEDFEVTVEDEPMLDPEVEDPITEEPDVDDPVTEVPDVEDPVTEEPAIDDPGIDEPDVEEPIIDDPDTIEPVELTITVEDQELGEDNMITIDQIDSPEDGWVLIHMEEDGEPGQVIGSEAIEEGENMNVMVEIDEDMADMISDGDTLYVSVLIPETVEDFMVSVDPGIDDPVTEDPITEDPDVEDPIIDDRENGIDN